MEVEQLFQNGPVVFTRNKFSDHRGSFEMIFEDSALREIYPQFPALLQVNALWANYGALRGVHAAARSQNHWKVVSCVAGAVREAVVDLRRESASFGKMRSVDISEDTPATLVIPPGFGHAVQGLSKQSLVVYGTNIEYANNKEFEINPTDLDWVQSWEKPIILSERDRLAPSLEAFLESNSLKEEI
jgi:dTDP-4-dehydrorhamnose 3,5-epimerase